MEKTRLTITIVVIGLLFLLSTIPIYMFQREFYINNRVAIRKFFYGVILLGVVLWIFDNFPFETVPELTIFLVSVIIIDLMIFQTPDITKFLTNELKHEQVEETFDKNRGAYEDLLSKLNKMNEVIEDNEEFFQTEVMDFTDPENYVSFINDYLEDFIQESTAKSYIYYIDPDVPLIQGIESAYNEVYKQFPFTYSQLGMRKSHFFKKLAEGSSIEIMKQPPFTFSTTKNFFGRNKLTESSESYMFFVYSGEYHSLLFLLASNQEFGATGANTPIIQNLLRTADMWIQKQILKGIDVEERDDEFNVSSIDVEDVE
ncbi:type II toxin-antitoxin system SpoIISA family toxin [Exiguobacterium sp. TNDT2]|uniref:type II toxin-antitoxin system SpoIISA family toxin n=1 Tax=Exiguobacterium sp. TNDT2 TaxID=2233531 RepID=UPI000DEF079F|nr:type II toxin-antitoxin system SpoIISA family toxin [Exiguobacterium sp. TNDT2]